MLVMVLVVMVLMVCLERPVFQVASNGDDGEGDGDVSEGDGGDGVGVGVLTLIGLPDDSGGDSGGDSWVGAILRPFLKIMNT